MSHIDRLMGRQSGMLTALEKINDGYSLDMLRSHLEGRLSQIQEDIAEQIEEMREHYEKA